MHMAILDEDVDRTDRAAVEQSIVQTLQKAADTIAKNVPGDYKLDMCIVDLEGPLGWPVVEIVSDKRVIDALHDWLLSQPNPFQEANPEDFT